MYIPGTNQRQIKNLFTYYVTCAMLTYIYIYMNEKKYIKYLYIYPHSFTKNKNEIVHELLDSPRT